jgi:hypothetical protein
MKILKNKAIIKAHVEKADKEKKPNNSVKYIQNLLITLGE